MAFLTTLICFILAYPLGLVLCSLNLKKSNFIIFLFILPMWMNFLLRTMAWQLILSNNGVLNTLLGFLHLPKVHIIYTFQAVLIGMVYDFLPFMILPIYNSLSSIGNDVVEAGKDLGAGYFTILRKSHFPAVSSRSHQRDHDGICSVHDFLRYFKHSGWIQYLTDRKYH